MSREDYLKGISDVCKYIENTYDDADSRIKQLLDGLLTEGQQAAQAGMAFGITAAERQEFWKTFEEPL